MNGTMKEIDRGGEWKRERMTRKGIQQYWYKAGVIRGISSEFKTLHNDIIKDEI